MPFSLPTFMMGLLVAYFLGNDLVHKMQKKTREVLFLIACITLFLYLRYFFFELLRQGRFEQVILTTLILGFVMFAMSIRIHCLGIFDKIVVWISKYQYGIYLWNFIIIANLKDKSPTIIGIMQKLTNLGYLVLTIRCIGVGSGMQMLVDGYVIRKRNRTSLL